MSAAAQRLRSDVGIAAMSTEQRIYVAIATVSGSSRDHAGIDREYPPLRS